MGTPEDFNDEYKFSDIEFYDFEIKGESYRKDNSIDVEDMPTSPKELLLTIKLIGKTPLDEDIKLFEIGGHYEEDTDFIDGENVVCKGFWEESKEELAQDNIKMLMNIHKWSEL